MNNQAPEQPVGLGGFRSPEDAVAFIGSVLESSTEYSMIATDPNGLIVLWNEGARRLYGYTPEEIIGKPLALLHTEEDSASGVPDSVARALRQGKWEGLVGRVRKDGSTFTARVVITPRRDAKGDADGCLLMSSDVTEGVRLNQELNRAEAYMRSLLESAPDALVIVNADGEIRLVNAETQRLFGYDREDLIGQPVEVLIPERYRARHPELRTEFFAGPRARPMGTALELWGRRQDGSEFPVEISLSPLETEGGLLATAAIRDVTERKRVEQDLGEAHAQLEAADRAKDRFLASMSHELRTPLNAILGFTGTLLMELPGSLNVEQTRQLRTVQKSGKHLLSLINDLLDLAKIESGKMELNVEPIECAGLLEEVALGLRPLADGKGLRLEVVVPDVGLEVRNDRRALSQILINLINNAIKFTDEGGVRVELSRQQANGDAASRFRVVDTGCGIAPSDQQALFAAFEQIGPPGDHAYEGTGLGLSICRTLATFVGAAISLESELGEGSTFTLEVPERR